MLILGVETSCDETAAAIVVDGRRVLSNVVASQDDLHAKFGGVVPEVACRAHVETITCIMEQALAEARAEPHDLEAVAAVNGPGLVGALIIGLTAAKTFAWFHHLPLVPVNHIAAHVYAANLAPTALEYPTVGLVASGGHTSLCHAASPAEVELSALPSTTLRARRSTRSQGSYGWAIRAAPRSRRLPRLAIRRKSGSPGPCSSPGRWISASPA